MKDRVGDWMYGNMVPGLRSGVGTGSPVLLPTGAVVPKRWGMG